MKYSNVFAAEFVSRPNRFIANVMFGTNTVVHVKNTGRCKELLVPGTEVYIQKADNEKRKTEYDLIAVKKGNRIFNIDSSAPNTVAYEFLLDKFDRLKREVRYKNSRFDLLGEKDGQKTFIEVKGVTLEKNNIALFPDAPTERGTKHLYELIDAKNHGYGACLLLIVQFEGAKAFKPNGITDPKFEKAIKLAKEAGVDIAAYGCRVTADTIETDGEKICLDL